MRNFRGKKVLVYGMGTSGQAACKLLHSLGAIVSFYDDEERFLNFYAYDKNPMLTKYDLVVVSPGIKVRGNELIAHFVSKGTKVISELDLGYMFCKGKIVGITGTNGKTTVTSLVGAILTAAGKANFVCGNIGLPLCAVALKTNKKSVAVCEVSSFQLELSRIFRADIAAILNIAPDHIDRHGSFEEYVFVKKKIIKPRQKLILCGDDEIVKGFGEKNKPTYYSLFPRSNGVYLRNNIIYYGKAKIMAASEVPLIGNKNLLNVMAAVAICKKLGVKSQIIRSAVMSYKPPKHRLMVLGKTKKGALVIDDSKATNISSVEMALESVDCANTYLLLGGLNKDCDFADFFAKLPPLKSLLCFGAAADYLASEAASHGVQAARFDSMKKAAAFAREEAGEGEIILLSPACASFDEFSSYAVRGEIFKEIIFEEA